MTNPKQALEQAIEIAGSQTALAEKVSRATGKPVKQAHVWKWLNKSGRVTADYIIGVSEAVGWRVTPHQLSPELYPNKSDGLPQTAA